MKVKRTTKRKMHPNSLDAYNKLRTGTIKKAIVDALIDCPEAMSDEGLARMLGRTHRQDVAPRITELTKAGIVKEFHKPFYNPITKAYVRRVELV